MGPKRDTLKEYQPSHHTDKPQLLKSKSTQISSLKLTNKVITQTKVYTKTGLCLAWQELSCERALLTVNSLLKKQPELFDLRPWQLPPAFAFYFKFERGNFGTLVQSMVASLFNSPHYLLQLWLLVVAARGWWFKCLVRFAHPQFLAYRRPGLL